MPKMKSNRGAAKRFKRTANGKIKRKKAFLRHILTKKGSKRKRALRKPDYVHKADADRIATTTALTSSKNPSTYGELISFRATVEDTNGDAVSGGEVQFSMDGQNFGDPVAVGADGIAESDTLGSPMAGDHTVMAAYLPDGLRGTPQSEAQCVDALLLAMFVAAPDDDAPPYRPH